MDPKKGKEKPGWYKPKITESSGNVIYGLKIVRQNKLYKDLLSISNSKNTPFKQELFSNLLKNSGHSIFKNEENVKRVSEVLSKNNPAVFDQLKSVFIAGGENNNVIKTLLRNWTLALPKMQNRTEWMLLNNYKNVSKSFVSELYKNDYLRNKIEEALKPTQPPASQGQPTVQQAAPQVKQVKAKNKSKKSTKANSPKSPKSVVYNVKNYGNIGSVGKNYGGNFTFADGTGKKPEEQENYNKMMESLLAYNNNISNHLKTLKEEIGKAVERPKGGFEFVSFKKPRDEKAERQGRVKELDQLEIGFKEKPVEGQFELPFNKLNNLIKKARENPEFEHLKNLYNFNSKPAREEFDKIVFENPSSDETQYDALIILLRNRDFDRMARAVKSDNWGFPKLQALQRIGNVVNDSNKDKAVELFSNLLNEKEVDEYYLTIHKTFDKIKDEKTRKYLFEKLKPSLSKAEDRMKSKARPVPGVQSEIKGLGGEALKDFLKPPPSTKKSTKETKPVVEPEPRELSDYEAVSKKLKQFIKNAKKERET